MVGDDLNTDLCMDRVAILAPRKVVVRGRGALAGRGGYSALAEGGGYSALAVMVVRAAEVMAVIVVRAAV